jgi:tRNA pseudouridine65 synthase
VSLDDLLPSPAVEILFADESLVIVNKPSGLLVHRGWDNDEDVMMMRVRDALGARVNPIHRLDRGTSGALVFGLTTEATSRLSALFANSEVSKTYLALVRGVAPAEGMVDSPVPQSEDGPRVNALTRFRLLGTSTIDRCSLVCATPETGRLHQVRRHLKHAGHPLLGDVNYGKGDLNRRFRELYNLHRLALHARTISFVHPVTAERVCAVAPVPDDLALPLDALGLLEASSLL